MTKKIFEFQNRSYGNFIIPEKRVIRVKSKFQNIEIFENRFFGRFLKLDDSFQTSEFDEFLYHEPLVHFPMFLIKNPQRILIIGGGDGGALEEITKYKEISEICLVEIDEEMIKTSKEYLKNINKCSFEDPRVKVVIEDGFKFLKDNTQKFDVVILDLTDPTKDSINLYTSDFYNLVSNNLKNEGVLSLHTGTYLNCPNIFSRIISTLRYVFKEVHVHSNFVPLYGTVMAFAICSKIINPLFLNKGELKERFNKRGLHDIKYFSPEIFFSSFVLPKYVLEIMNSCPTIYTLNSPIQNTKNCIK